MKTNGVAPQESILPRFFTCGARFLAMLDEGTAAQKSCAISVQEICAANAFSSVYTAEHGLVVDLHGGTHQKDKIILTALDEGNAASAAMSAFYQIFDARRTIFGGAR